MQLFPHQKQALAWNDNRKGFALFMHMRLGKSLVAVRQCAKWGSNQVLLIAPMSTWFDWITLLESECQSVCVLEGTRADKQHFLQTQGNAFDWLIVNPQTIARWGKEFFEWLALCCSIDTCILDEATFIKNPKAKISKLLLKHREHFDRRIIMTGTPISDKTEDIVNLMIWVHDSFMECGNFYEWRTNYMSPARFGWRLKKGIKDYIKHELASKSFRLTAKEVGHYTTQIKRT